MPPDRRGTPAARPLRRRSMAAMILLAALPDPVLAQAVNEAIQLRQSLSPALCRLQTLELALRTEIGASGLSQQEFFSRRADDPDPRVQRVMRINGEIQAIGESNSAAFRKAKDLMSTLSTEDREKVRQIDRQELGRCKKA